MATLISAVVADSANSRPKKKKSGKSAKNLGPSNPIEIRGNIIEFETGLLGETVDPLTVAPPSANQNSTEQEPARTVKPDAVSFNAEKFQQSSAPCYNGIGSDDIELKQHISSKMDTSNAGALNGGYSKSGGDGSSGSTPSISRETSPLPAPSVASRGGDFSGISKVTTDGVAKTTTTTSGFFGSPEGRARSSSTTNSSSSPVGDELKRKASAFGSLFKSKVKSAGESIGELVDKAKEKVDTIRSEGKNNYQLQKEEDTTGNSSSSNADGGNYGGHENPKSTWTEM